MLNTIVRLTLGLVALGAGLFGIYSLTHTTQVIAEKNQPMIAFILIVSIVMIGLGGFLLTESKLQEKVQTKLGEA
ncbi:hypothetical protein K8Q94_03640 [Candidatus Nomurabacteria bacterium]|nr:hypothetical protein [Candidatus Nomurabacteria bacterium]